MSKTVEPYVVVVLGAVVAAAGAVVGFIFLSVSRSQTPPVVYMVDSRNPSTKQQAPSAAGRDIDETPDDQSEDPTRTSVPPVDAAPVADSPEAPGQVEAETAKTMIDLFRGTREHDALDAGAKEADLETAKTMIGIFREALEQYTLDTKEYPTTEQGLLSLTRPPRDADESTAFDWDGPYLRGDVIPKDPWGNDYQYAYPPEKSDGKSPDIWSWGPDGRDSTADDICSWPCGMNTRGKGRFGETTEANERLGLPVEVTNSIGMKLRLIPAGEFMMGSPESDEDANDDERPQHRVGITKPFYLGVTEVTQGQWEAVMETRPWSGGKFVNEGADYAASYVNWEDAVAFCVRLSSKEGVTYRLPTEAEWEYACRAGTTTVYHFGDNTSHVGDYAWWGGLFGDGNCRDEKYAHPVGQKKANLFGLCDMHGNVWEWCQDKYGEDYYAVSPPEDPPGPDSGSIRVSRGGSWYDGTRGCRSALRNRASSGQSADRLGFRLARSPSGK